MQNISSIKIYHRIQDFLGIFCDKKFLEKVISYRVKLHKKNDRDCQNWQLLTNEIANCEQILRSNLLKSGSERS